MTSSPRPLPFSFCGLRGSCSNRDRLYMQGSGLGNHGDSLQTIIKYFCWKATSSTQVYKTAFSVSSAFNMLITQDCLGISEQGNTLHWSKVFRALAVCRKIISSFLIKTGVGMHLLLFEPFSTVPDDGWQKQWWTLHSCSQPYISFALGKPRQLKPDVLFFNSQRTILFVWITNSLIVAGRSCTLSNHTPSPVPLLDELWPFRLVWRNVMAIVLVFCDFRTLATYFSWHSTPKLAQKVL